MNTDPAWLWWLKVGVVLAVAVCGLIECGVVKL